MLDRTNVANSVQRVANCDCLNPKVGQWILANAQAFEKYLRNIYVCGGNVLTDSEMIEVMEWIYCHPGQLKVQEPRQLGGGCIGDMGHVPDSHEDDDEDGVESQFDRQQRKAGYRRILQAATLQPPVRANDKFAELCKVLLLLLNAEGTQVIRKGELNWHALRKFVKASGVQIADTTLRRYVTRLKRLAAAPSDFQIDQIHCDQQQENQDHEA